MNRFQSSSPYASSQDGSSNHVEPIFSFASNMCEDTQSYLQQYYTQNNFQYSQQPPFQADQVDANLNMNTTDMLNIPNQTSALVFEDDLLQDLFAMDTYKPAPDMSTVFNNDIHMHHEPLCGVMLPQNLVQQILSTNATQDSSSVLEMLRNNIMSSIEAQQADTRPVLATETLFAEKKEKKSGIKKRRYVKSGLYRKDKSGNFIYSSSDRARMGKEDGTETGAPVQEQAEATTPTAGTRVKRPLNAYNIFCKLHFDQVKTENPELSINELSKLMGEKWKSMSASNKKAYYDKVEHGQTRYKKPLNSYNLYCKKNFEALKKEFPQKSIHVLSKVIAERWKKLSDTEKRVYYDEAERQKKQGQQQEENEQEQSIAITPIESSETFEQSAPEYMFDSFL